MNSSFLDITHRGPVATVFLNRPEVRNAFNQQVIADMTAAFEGLAQDPTVRAVVLGGHGKAFCAGADLTWMQAMASYPWDENRADAEALAAMLWAIFTSAMGAIYWGILGIMIVVGAGLVLMLFVKMPPMGSRATR